MVLDERVPDEQGFSVLILWSLFIYKLMYLVVAQGDGCTVRYVVIAFKFLLTSNVLALTHKYHLVVMGWFRLPVLRFHRSQQSAPEHWFFFINNIAVWAAKLRLRSVLFQIAALKSTCDYSIIVILSKCSVYKSFLKS